MFSLSLKRRLGRHISVIVILAELNQFIKLLDSIKKSLLIS